MGNGVSLLGTLLFIFVDLPLIFLVIYSVFHLIGAVLLRIAIAVIAGPTFIASGRRRTGSVRGGRRDRRHPGQCSG